MIRRNCQQHNRPLQEREFTFRSFYLIKVFDYFRRQRLTKMLGVLIGQERWTHKIRTFQTLKLFLVQFCQKIHNFKACTEKSILLGDYTFRDMLSSPPILSEIGQLTTYVASGHHGFSCYKFSSRSSYAIYRHLTVERPSWPEHLWKIVSCSLYCLMNVQL